MSFDRIAELLSSAQDTFTRASLEDATTAQQLKTEARQMRSHADDVAAHTKPGVIHEIHGYGVAVGVTAGGLVEVTFAGQPFAVSVLVDDLSGVT